jgi:hypothetical protein
MTHKIQLPLAPRLTRRAMPRHAHPATGEPIYDPDEVEFMTALDRYKREANRPFPTCCEVLQVLKALGYRK